MDNLVYHNTIQFFVGNVFGAKSKLEKSISSCVLIRYLFPNDSSLSSHNSPL